MDIRCSVVYLFLFNFIWTGKLVLYQYCRRVTSRIILQQGFDYFFIIVVGQLFFLFQNNQIKININFRFVPFPLKSHKVSQRDSD